MADVAAQAREQARDVLADQRFQPSGVPQPLREPRERIGEALRALGGPFEDAFAFLAELLPGGPPVLWALLGALVLGAAVFLATRAGARRVRAGADGAAGTVGVRPSAAKLRAEADRAEARGDLDTALRLRFRAGLVELDARELIELRPGLLLRAVPSPTLAGLVDGFEAVAYGGRPADGGDLRSARDGWPRVPAEARAT